MCRLCCHPLGHQPSTMPMFPKVSTFYSSVTVTVNGSSNQSDVPWTSSPSMLNFEVSWPLEDLLQVSTDAVNCCVQGSCPVQKWALLNTCLTSGSYILPIPLSMKFSDIWVVGGWYRWTVCLSKHLWTHTHTHTYGCTHTHTIKCIDELGFSNNFYY